MNNTEILELPTNTRLSSIYDNSETIYLFQYHKSVNNILCAFVQKITENNVEILTFPLNYFQNEFVKYVEPKVEETFEILEAIVEEKEIPKPVKPSKK